jgi:two-component system NtrC family sensor kinase
MLLEIADNGPGIDPAHFPKLFDPFFTTKEVGEGTGLGLSISHNIVMAHGGRIEVGGAFGQGATFRVYLPLKAGRV